MNVNAPVRYRCSNPGHPPEAPAVFDEMSEDGFCAYCAYGEGILEAVTPEMAAHTPTFGDSRPRHSGEIGLCLLPCDVSGSMFGECFPGNPARTIDLVVRAAAAGISDLYSLSNAHDAYIAIMPFAEEARLLDDGNGQPFLFSISEIKSRYPSPEALGAFLATAFVSAEVGGLTDFNKPLALAREIYDQALGGSLGAWGGPQDFVLKTHDLIDIRSGQTVSVPNIRVLLYSDGEHNAEQLQNPFVGETYSPLLTMFFGQQGVDGADQMHLLACTCPQHDRPGFFLVDTPASFASLRHLFRMASGTSGFCPECSRVERIERRRDAA